MNARRQDNLSDVSRRHSRPFLGLTGIAGVLIQQYRAVASDGAGKLIKQGTDTLGVALNEADPGSPVKVAIVGMAVENPAWTFAKGPVLYDATGLLNQSSGQVVGLALTPTRIIVQPRG